MKKITLYFINFNDSFYLPFIKKHYGEFCQRIVMYDNHSTDDSQAIAKSLGFTVRTFGTSGQLNDQDYLTVKNNAWKECRTYPYSADYVIVCDADEFVIIDNHILHSQNIGPSAPKVLGFNMVSDDLPISDIAEINTGEYSKSYSKQAIFCPNRIKEINYVHGCHEHRIEGDVTTGGATALYHYRQIGGVDRIIQRHAEYRNRLSAFNRMHGMGIHYLHTDEQRREEFETLKKQAIELW